MARCLRGAHSRAERIDNARRGQSGCARIGYVHGDDNVLLVCDLERLLIALVDEIGDQEDDCAVGKYLVYEVECILARRACAAWLEEQNLVNEMKHMGPAFARRDEL